MDITGKTTLIGLLGSPIKHSISPQMHNEAFRLTGQDYVYLAFDVTEETMPSAIRGLVDIGCRGFNVTMPLKKAVVSMMDELTPAANICQACNTVINDNGHLIGHTTDGLGFMGSVADAGYDLTGKTMTLLGVGGAGTAICAQAALDGVKRVDIFVRPASINYPRNQAFVRRVLEQTDCDVRLLDITNPELLKESIQNSDILTNATSVGMAPDHGCLIPDESFLKPGLIVYDIIYNPIKTGLYKMAENYGTPTYNGLDMVLFQGAASFECWTGVPMPVQAIREKFFSKS